MQFGYKKLLAEANAAIKTLSIADAKALYQGEGVLFVDVRDIRELTRDGIIPGAFHAPRGMLEFWIDPESPYHKAALTSGKQLVFYCASGWRSALAAFTVQRMGLESVAHIAGGFSAWQDANCPVEPFGRAAG